ncbi:SH3 domain-containing protein [Kytococcus sedentarius]|uniref:SH3 domain-containing protein n=1 Tax=Kytococcus sedentarius TaxID=1276 RepID=UPI0035BBA573
MKHPSLPLVLAGVLGLSATAVAQAQPAGDLAPSAPVLSAGAEAAPDAGDVTSDASTRATRSYRVTAAWLTVRTGPTTSYSSLGALRKGTVVKGTKQSNGWVRFTHNGRTAYASGRYLQATSTAPTPTGTVVRHVKQRTGDLFVDVYSRRVASSAHEAHYLPRGGMVKGTIEGNWLKMAPNRYVPLSDLTTAASSHTGSNGRHHPSTLCAVQGSDVAPHVLLACDAVSPLKGLNRAYKARFNEDLPWDECYRTYDTQVAYRRAFGSKAAVPGYSNHGSVNRPACDVPEDARRFGFGTARHTWLLANGPRYGWVHPSWAKPWGKNPEYWHFEYAG